MSAAQSNEADAMGQVSTQPLRAAPASGKKVLRGDELLQHVADRLGSGAREADVCCELIAMGYPAADAGPWVANVVAWRRKHGQDRALPQYPQARGSAEPGPSNSGSGWFGRGSMGVGGLVFMVGILLTLSYQGAVQGSGQYYVFRGLIAWGAVQFLVGWWNRNR